MYSGLNGAEDAGWEGEDRADELEDSADHEADEAEGEQDEPDKRVEDQREQSRGPADDEQDQEEEKLHGVVASFLLRCTQGRGCGFPWLVWVLFWVSFRFPYSAILQPPLPVLLNMNNPWARIANSVPAVRIVIRAKVIFGVKTGAESVGIALVVRNGVADEAGHQDV